MLIKQNDEAYQINVDGGEWKKVNATTTKSDGRFTLRINIEGTLKEFSAVISPENVAVFDDVNIENNIVKKKITLNHKLLQTGKTELEIVKPSFLNAAEISGDLNKSSVVSPMPGVLDKLLVKAGDQVKTGDPLAVIIGKFIFYLNFNFKLKIFYLI